jgi:predicted Holliday junction resolvase-like endonuclease
LEWNLEYWANAFRNIYIDPLKMYNGKSYYGYTEDLKITNVVATKREPVDEVYKRHFLKRRERSEEKEEEVKVDEEVQKKKNRADALKKIRGE